MPSMIHNYFTDNQGCDLQNIVQQSYNYLMILPMLWLTYDGRLIYETSYEGRKIVWDTACKLAYNIPNRNLSTLLVTTVSRSYDKLKTISYDKF